MSALLSGEGRPERVSVPRDTMGAAPRADAVGCQGRDSMAVPATGERSGL
ncbi:hypothetical protein [Kitasatospora sp. NPDC088783]